MTRTLAQRCFQRAKLHADDWNAEKEPWNRNLIQMLLIAKGSVWYRSHEWQVHVLRHSGSYLHASAKQTNGKDSAVQGQDVTDHKISDFQLCSLVASLISISLSWCNKSNIFLSLFLQSFILLSLSGRSCLHVAVSNLLFCIRCLSNSCNSGAVFTREISSRLQIWLKSSNSNSLLCFLKGNLRCSRVASLG